MAWGIQSTDVIQWINFLLSLGGIVVNLVYINKSKSRWCWMKLMGALVCMYIAITYTYIIFDGGVPAIITRMGITLILLTYVAGGITSLYRRDPL